MKINKKGISVLLSGMLLSGMLVGCSDNKDKTMDKADTKIEEQKFNEEVVADNEYFKMTVLDKDMDEYNSFVRIKVLVENKTDKDIIVYLENICVDGVMNDPAWCVEVTANNKAYPYIEWLIDSETNPNVKTVEDLKNIDGEIYVTDSNYNELFRTDINMLMTKDNVKTEAKATKEKKDKEIEVAKDKSEEKEVAKDKEEEKAPSQDNNKSDEKQIDTKKDNNSTKKKPVTKEEPKEKPVYDEYGYDQNGNYDPNEDLYNDREWDDEDHKRWEEIHGDDIEDEEYSEQEASDVYWCGECQCFSTYKHNHPIEEADDVE